MTAPAPTLTQVREAWDAVAPGFDEHDTPFTMAFAEPVLGRLELTTETRFLDVAAGSGGVSIPAARRGAQVLATDLSPTMIEHLEARVRAEGLTNVEARVMDGCALQLDDDAFDVAASMNGVSLFPDLEQGLRELKRVVRPGGHVLILAFGSFQKAEWLGYFMAAARAVVDGFTGPPTDPPPLPFQLADPAVIGQRFAAAGLPDVDVETVTWEMTLQSGTHLFDLIRSSNPIGAALVADFTDHQRAEVRDVLDGMLRERAGGTLPAILTTEMNIALATVT